MVTLAALDPALVKRCPAPERFFGVMLAALVILNGFIVSLATFFFLDKVGHDFHFVFPLSVAAGVWFINLQRFLLLLHGQRRKKWTQFYSRIVCSIFMGFFAVLSFLSFYDGALQSKKSLVLASEHPLHLLTILIGLFILPVYMRKKFFKGSVYSELESKERAYVIQRWNEEFSRNYTYLVRTELGEPEYVMPHAMLCDLTTPTNPGGWMT